VSEIDDEIAFHLDMLTRDLIAAGMSPNDAREEAVRRFGDAGKVRDAVGAVRRPRMLTALTLLAVAIASSMHRLLWFIPAYASLHSHHAFYIAESIKNICEVGICIVALLLMGERAIARALRIDRRVAKAFLFAAAAAWPMYAGFALTRSSHVANWIAVVYLAFWSPFAEEIVMRGFAFATLRRIGWPMWPAALLVALVAGLTHIEKGQTRGEILGIFGLLAVGGCTFCWLFERWQSLWFPFAVHAAMNFSWEIFNVGRTALGGWYAFTLQNATVLLAILITLRFTKKREPLQTIGEDRLGDRRELHVRCALVDLSDLRVAPEFLDRILFAVSVAAEDLDRHRSHVFADLGREQLCHRGFA
jgi:membrane protease YdiL (CAAX protease family)